MAPFSTWCNGPGYSKLHPMACTQEEFGIRIRALRRKTGLSQERFADAIGVGRTHMGKIENGRANPTLQILVRIALGLDRSLAQLFETMDGRPDWADLDPTASRSHPGPT
jgi:transcriptional regulator with XRE-family HTH domain